MSNTKESASVRKSADRGFNRGFVLLCAMLMVVVIATIIAYVGSALNVNGVGASSGVDVAIGQAAALEPHFAQSVIVWRNDDVELESYYSLEQYDGCWGVVLDDGTVVLNPYKGEVSFKEGVPVHVAVEPSGNEAIILLGMILPECWRNHTITIMRQNEAAAVHYVTVAQSRGTYEGDVPAEYWAEMWVWTGDHYEYGLDAVPDDVRRSEPGNGAGQMLL